MAVKSFRPLKRALRATVALYAMIYDIWYDMIYDV